MVAFMSEVCYNLSKSYKRSAQNFYLYFLRTRWLPCTTIQVKPFLLSSINAQGGDIVDFLVLLKSIKYVLKIAKLVLDIAAKIRKAQKK